MTEEGRRLLAAATKRPWRWEGAFGRDEEWSSNGPDLMAGDGVVLGAWGHDAWGIDVHEADAALIVAAVNQYEALLDLAEEVSRTQPTAVEMFRRNGIVFDKWPPEIIPPERWNAETLAALDPEVRWQAVAFSLYTDLCQLASHADAALPPSRDSTPDPLE